MKKKLIIKQNKKEISKEHRAFLKKEYTKTFFVHFFRILLIIFIIGIWEISANLNWVDPFITSSPSRIVKQIVLLYESGSLFMHIFTTLNETILAFILSTLFGFVFALTLFIITPLKRILEPYIIILNSLPKIALGPLIIIWVGIGTKAIVTMGILIFVVIATINMLNSYLSVPNEKILLLKSMGANRFQILTHLIIPATIPDFISTLKINLGMAWVGVIMGEYLSSKAGLGYLLVYGGQVFKLDLVMSAIVILCILSALMYGLIAIFEKIINHRR